MKKLFLMLFLGSSGLAAAQQNVRVLDYDMKVDVDNATSYTVKTKVTKEILNDKGADGLDFVETITKDVSISSFSGVVKDATGKVLKKAKKSDLVTTEYSTQFATDVKHVLYGYTSPTYPVTVTYEWEVHVSGGYAELPSFVPQTEYDVEVEKASYTLTMPADMKFQYKVFNTQLDAKESVVDKKKVLAFSIGKLEAVRDEYYDKSLINFVPVVYVKPETFKYFGYQGTGSEWKDLGVWLSNLAAGRDVLPEDMKARLHELTDNCKTDLEKVKAVYGILDKTTRYLSVQLGIGGLQPTKASEVCKVGYGDCKGLSNYMKAMLKEIGIDSYLTAISTKRADVPDDFPAFSYFNHMVLKVPLQQETLWVECTNPKLPLGYVHEDIAGHEGLVIDGENSRLECLPVYQDTLNARCTEVNVEVAKDGSAKLLLNEHMTYSEYEEIYGLSYADRDQKQRYLNSAVTYSSPVWEEPVLQELKPDLGCPTFIIGCKGEVPKCGRATGKTLFLPVSGSSLPYVRDFGRETRQHPIHIGYGYQNEVVTVYNLPEGCSVANVPQNVEIDNPFAHYAASTTVEGRKVTMRQKIVMHKGDYTIDMFPQLKAMMGEVAKYNRRQVAVKMGD